MWTREWTDMDCYNRQPNSVGGWLSWKDPGSAGARGGDNDGVHKTDKIAVDWGM
jgi:hypothetical protein